MGRSEGIGPVVTKIPDVVVPVSLGGEEGFVFFLMYEEACESTNSSAFLLLPTEVDDCEVMGASIGWP